MPGVAAQVPGNCNCNCGTSTTNQVCVTMYCRNYTGSAPASAGEGDFPINGVIFRLSNSSGNNWQCTTANQGTCCFSSVPDGTYKLGYVSGLPDNYVTPVQPQTSQSVTVSGGKTVSVKFWSHVKTYQICVNLEACRCAGDDLKFTGTLSDGFGQSIDVVIKQSEDSTVYEQCYTFNVTDNLKALPTLTITSCNCEGYDLPATFVYNPSNAANPLPLPVGCGNVSMHFGGTIQAKPSWFCCVYIPALIGGGVVNPNDARIDPVYWGCTGLYPKVLYLSDPATGIACTLNYNPKHTNNAADGNGCMWKGSGSAILAPQKKPTRCTNPMCLGCYGYTSTSGCLITVEYVLSVICGKTGLSGSRPSKFQVGKAIPSTNLLGYIDCDLMKRGLLYPCCGEYECPLWGQNGTTSGTCDCATPFILSGFTEVIPHCDPLFPQPICPFMDTTGITITE